MYFIHKHPDEILLDSEIWYRKGSLTEFKSASLMKIRFLNSSELKHIEKNKDILKRITKESVNLTTQRYNWNLENIHEVYRVMLNSNDVFQASYRTMVENCFGAIKRYMPLYSMGPVRYTIGLERSHEGVWLNLI